MTRARLRTAALGGWLLLGAIGCQTRTGDEMDWGPISTPPWTVGGAKPGMTPEDVERLLGPPTSTDTSYGRTTTRYTISVYEDRLASVRAQPLPVSKR